MAKYNFFTPWSPPPDVPQDASSTKRPKFVPEKQLNGTVELVQHGEEDIYELIQSHRDEVDLKLLLQRCAARGDYSLIEQRKPVYGDLVGLPRDLTDAQNRILLTRKKYDALSDDTKSLFNGFDDFVDQVTTGKLSDRVKNHFEPVVEAPSVEVEVKD